MKDNWTHTLEDIEAASHAARPRKPRFSLAAALTLIVVACVLALLQFALLYAHAANPAPLPADDTPPPSTITVVSPALLVLTVE